MKRRQATADEGVVYFVRGSQTRLVKIGSCHADRLNHRLAELRRFSPDELLIIGAVIGGQPLEMDLHRRFSHLRANGEWFTPAPELMVVIAALVLEKGWVDPVTRLAMCSAALQDVTCHKFGRLIEAEEERLKNERRILLGPLLRLQHLIDRKAGEEQLLGPLVTAGGVLGELTHEEVEREFKFHAEIEESNARLRAAAVTA